MITKEFINFSLLDEVSGTNLMKHTKEICREVRLSGSKEELAAFHYVQQQLEKYGLKTKLTRHPAYISLPMEAQLSCEEEIIPCITHAMALSTGDEGMNGELIYLGEWNQAKHSLLSFEGKIIVVDGIAIPPIVRHVEKVGAKAVIFINGLHTHEMIVSTVWGNPTDETISLLPNIPVVSVNQESGQKLINKSKLNSTKVWLKTIVETGWRDIPYIEAELKGSGDPDKFVLFSSHIDSWHYGAMDNASSNATMLEVARVLAKKKETMTRSIRFVFWSGHSHGRYAGSTMYCDSHWEELHQNCVLHVYTDSAGAKGASILGDSNCMAETKDLAKKYVEALTGEEFIGRRFAKGGDQSFWGPGVPSLFMGMSEQPISDDVASKTLVKLFGGNKAGGFGWWWHTTEDTFDKIDEANLVRDCKVYLATLYEACTAKLIPINQKECVSDLRNILVGYEQQVGEKIDLSLSMSRCDQLLTLLDQVEQIQQTRPLKDEDAIIYNDLNMKLSRVFVPISYVEGDQFDHDLAVNQPAIPSLRKISDLEGCEVGSDEFYQLTTFLRRRINKLNYRLLEASELIKATLTYLKEGQ